MRLCAPTIAPTRPRGTLSSALWSVQDATDERRDACRASFGFRLMLTPLEGVEPIGESILVTGRDLSARGIGFEHHEPFTHRKVRLTADDPALTALGFDDLEIDLMVRWCRFLGPGRYESGGRITRTNAPLF